MNSAATDDRTVFFQLDDRTSNLEKDGKGDSYYIHPGGRETARAFCLVASRRVTVTCNLQYKMLFRTLWKTEFWSKKVDAKSIDF